MRQDLVGGKRGDGHRRSRPIRRPDPRKIRVGRADPSLHAVRRARAVSYQRPGHKPQTVLTALTGPRQYSAVEVELLYHECWELELRYDEVETDMLLGLESIRGKSPEMVKQELWGIFLTDNAGPPSNGSRARGTQARAQENQLRCTAASPPGRMDVV